MKLYTSDEILNLDHLYDLQDSFSSCGVPFSYKMTSDELNWFDFIYNKYSIGDFIYTNLVGDILTFHCPFELSKCLKDDDCNYKAIMLSDETALQKLFFWLNIND